MKRRSDSARTRRSYAREHILACALDEFLEKGFSGASLRAIAARAAVTTGAIYGYFSSKADLFDALVAPAADELLRLFHDANDRFYEFPVEQQDFDCMCQFSDSVRIDMLDFVYANRDAFLLVYCKSAGTSWERYLDRFAEIESASTLRYARMLRERGDRVRDVDSVMADMLSKMYFRSCFEILMEGLPRAEARERMDDLSRFFQSGYEALIIPPEEEASED